MKYPIRAASRLSGVAIDTLRAWERRYAVVTPKRDGRGRLYSAADVARLRLLHDAVAQGHAIGRLASLSTAELKIAAAGADAAPATGRIDTGRLLEAITEFDAALVDAEIGRFAATLAPEALLNVVMPLLTAVGDSWHQRRATVAHEHLISATLRNVLGSLLRVYGPARSAAGARLLFATPAGERHELGTLGAAMMAATTGASVIYLGPDLPAMDIAASAKPARARAVVLGVTRSTDRKKTETELRTVARHLPADVELWIGGRHAPHFGPALGARALLLPDYASFNRELTRIAGR